MKSIYKMMVVCSMILLLAACQRASQDDGQGHYIGHIRVVNQTGCLYSMAKVPGSELGNVIYQLPKRADGSQLAISRRSNSYMVIGRYPKNQKKFNSVLVFNSDRGDTCRIEYLAGTQGDQFKILKATTTKGTCSATMPNNVFNHSIAGMTVVLKDCKDLPIKKTDL